MKPNQDPLYSGVFYHIYNRANGNDPLFVHPGNYDFFLMKYNQYLLPYIDTYAYCLMSNHFHLLVKIKSEDAFLSLEKFQFPEDVTREEKEKSIAKFLSQQFSHFFNGYAQAFNKQENRRGSLFMQPYKRKQVQDEQHLLRLVYYIHHNPVKAGLCKRIEDWKHSSYNTILSDKTTWIERDSVIQLFGSKEDFILFHQQDLPGLQTPNS
ncbi:MAG TPA: transposase [Agriterribacter sp.]|nr:transposase [Agriterribacter sp.]